jgi:hypothetical protein
MGECKDPQEKWAPGLAMNHQEKNKPILSQ